MNLTAPLSLTSSSFHRSHSDHDLLVNERCLTRTHLNSFSSSSNIPSTSTINANTTSTSLPTTSSRSACLPWDRFYKNGYMTLLL